MGNSIEQDGQEERRTAGFVRRWAAPVLGVVAASAVVGIGAAGMELVRPPAELAEGRSGPLRLGGALVAVAGLLVLLVQQRRLRSAGSADRDPAGPALFSAAAIMALLAWLAVFGPATGIQEGGPGGQVTWGDAPPPDEPLPPPPEPPPSASPPEPEPEPPPPDDEAEDEREGEIDPSPPAPPEAQREERAPEGFDWSDLRGPTGILFLILLLVVAGGAWLALSGRLRRGSEGTEEPARSEAEPDAARDGWPIERLRTSRDPRDRITFAYYRLLSAFAAAGAPRRQQEAPFEHLHRVLEPLGVRPEPLIRLTELYVAAQFGARPPSDRQRAEAEEVLEIGLAELQKASPTLREPDGAVPVQQRTGT